MFKQSIFLTGGTGFFGKALLRYWQQQSAPPQVTILSRAPERFLQNNPEFVSLPWLSWQTGDILCPETLPAQRHFSHILHAATDSTLGPQLTPLQRYQQIVEGTQNILNFAVTQHIPRLLLTSSGAVYGTLQEAVHEDYCGMPDPLNTDHAYGVGKRVAEHLCALYRQQYGLQTVIARCFAFVGQDLPLDIHFAIGNFIRDALWAEKLLIQGNGTPIRSYMDQRDLAHWLMVLLQQGEAGQAYNVGSDQAINLADLAHLVRDLLSPEKDVVIADKNQMPTRNIYVPQTLKAQQLNLKLSYSLTQAILDTASYYQNKEAR